MTDRQLDLIIARILRWGVGLSAAIVLAGGVWYVAANSDVSLAQAVIQSPHDLGAPPRDRQ